MSRGDRHRRQTGLDNSDPLCIVVAASVDYLDEKLIGAIWVGGEFVVDLT